MATLAELNAKVDELQVALDNEQAEIQAAIENLNGIIADLEAQVADGGSPEDRQAVIDRLESLRADLEATVVPESEEPEEPGEGEDEVTV